MIVRMNDKSIASVAGPAPCLARFLPNSISRSRLSAGSFTLPSVAFSDVITAAFDRRGGLPTSCMSLSCRSIRSPNVRTFRTTRGLEYPLRSMLRSISSAHSSPSLRRRNVSATYRVFRRTWTRQFPDAICVKVATRVHSDFRVHYVCTERSKRVQTCAISSSLECTRSPFIPLKSKISC